MLAIGNPFGFQSTLTTGVVSALGRTVQTGQTTFIDGAIQTDAAINQGNSGGPLLNSHGEVIGINSRDLHAIGHNRRHRLRHPHQHGEKQIAQDLITEGRVHRASLGISLSLELWPDLAQAMNLPVEQGLLIEQVSRDGAAARSGLHGGDKSVYAGLHRIIVGGDLIVAVDGKEVARQLDLDVIMNHEKPGNTVRVTIYRGGKKMDVNVTLGEQPQSGQR